jgi:hypothetical protein
MLNSKEQQILGAAANTDSSRTGGLRPPEGIQRENGGFRSSQSRQIRPPLSQTVM